MSAVLVCSDPSTVRLELRSAALTLMAVVLKTTDLALLADELAKVEPWVVRYIDPAPAIARRFASMFMPRSLGQVFRG